MSTNTWRNALEHRGDTTDGCRDRLKNAFIGFRERVGQLIQTIPSDVVGLTVHDLTHLDALWEMADILTGGSYDLNPAETFVLGGAILLHDSAMTVAAYANGIAEIKGTLEYSDAQAAISERLGKPHTSTGSTQDPVMERFAIAETLRLRHAAKAEELASQKWKSPISEVPVYLIDDTELREHYSRVIGRIAHSHHWDITGLSRNLGPKLGAFAGFPVDWTVDQIKVALILRCIDAMQVDDRRAPSFLASIRDIGPESLEHWRFQNMLAVPHVEDHRLVYTSKRPFNIEHAGAWNLCFDTIQMIDRELRDANDLQGQKNLPRFQASSVAGASSAENFAKYVEVSGWQPLPLKLNASDVPKLARTLGGKDLYNEPLAPLRELIQNAADAIEVRCLLDEDFSVEDGLITIRLIENGDETILELEDNGIGMSERTLTTALLDFGFSFWKSSAARNEFPGLQAKVDSLRGKYGIGFFSIFMWSSRISVSSRRCNEGLEEAKVMEFRQGLESRPLLRSAVVGEKSSKWSTRIRAVLGPNFLRAPIPHTNGREGGSDAWRYLRSRGHAEPYEGKSWLQRIKLLCGPLPIRVNLDVNSSIQQASLPNWRDCPPNQFHDFFGDALFSKTAESDRFISTLSSLMDQPPFGGRCFLSPYARSSAAIGVYEKGIFITFAGIPGVSGIVLSKVANAARDRFSGLSVSIDKVWLDAVRPKAFSLCRNIGERLALQSFLSSLHSLEPSQPAFIRNREFISLAELKRTVLEEGVFHIRLQESHNENFTWKTADKLALITDLSVNERRYYPLISFEGDISRDADLAAHLHTSEQPLFRFLRDIRDTLGSNVKVTSERHEVSGYHEDYIDVTLQVMPID